MQLSDLFSLNDLAAEIAAGNVARKAHPTLPLSTLGYTQKCQFNHHWTDVTMRCRGLVVEDETDEIVAWCFPKMFNYGEHGHGNLWAPDLPDEPFTIYDKVDGSLGVIFHYANGWHVATRGSFTSDQAKWAQAWIDRKDALGRPVTSMLIPGHTYLAEIIYPENRIVVNHGSRRDLVALSAFDHEGVEYPAHATDLRIMWLRIGSVVRSWPLVPLDALVRHAAQNLKLDGESSTGTDAEGWMIRYESGLRVKAKLSRYVELHAILTGMNERTVWEVLANGGSLDDLLTNVPDEFMRWVQDVADRLRQAHAEKVLAANMAYAAVATKATRKEFAKEAIPTGLSSMLFRLYDGKGIDEMAWKMVKPSGTATFSSGEGE